MFDGFLNEPTMAFVFHKIEPFKTSSSAPICASHNTCPLRTTRHAYTTKSQVITTSLSIFTSPENTTRSHCMFDSILTFQPTIRMSSPTEPVTRISPHAIFASCDISPLISNSPPAIVRSPLIGASILILPPAIYRSSLTTSMISSSSQTFVSKACT